MKTKKLQFGLIGERLDYSYSPIIHKNILKKMDIVGDYSLIEIKKEELESVVLKLKKNELDGINITIPYKTEIMKYLDEISESAKLIGAVNTVISKNGKLIGYNTDYDGFKMTLEKLGIKLENQKNFVCGAGGAGKAILKCLEDLKGINYLVTRNKEKAKKEFSNFRDLKVVTYSELEGIKDKNLIVNCTPLGTAPNFETSILEEGEKSQYKGAIDIVYNPKETKFLRNFKIKENGLLMLVGQAIKAEEIWHGKKLDRQSIDKIYNEVSELVYKN